jgi:hypothetical protein
MTQTDRTLPRPLRATALVSLLLVAGCATQPAPVSVAGSLPAAEARPAAAALEAEPAPVAAAVATAASAARPSRVLAPPTAVEIEHGLQIAHVGLTASGGLVDVRFKVLDVAKVRALLGDATHAPTLIAGDKPPLMAPHNALRGARFIQGQIFYILYPNLRNAVQSGAEVVVAMGDVRLGPVTAQ